MIKEVEIRNVWGWDCPECGRWNEEVDGPNYQGRVVCEECFEEFTPVPA